MTLASAQIRARFGESECSCETCRTLCRTNPCLPTPDDARRLVRAGLADRLTVRVRNGTTAVWPKRTIFGCTFLTADGLCELHGRGLKPTEGRCIDHTVARLSANEPEGKGHAIQRAILTTWNTAKAQRLAARIQAGP